MTRTAVKIIIAVVSAGAAGGVGYFVWKKRRGKKTSAKAEVTYVAYDPNRFDDKPSSIVRDEDDHGTSLVDIPKKEFAKKYSEYMTLDEKDNMEAYFAGMEAPDDEEDDEEDDEDDIPDIPHDGPYLITAGEFCNNRTYYDKISLNYFTDDHVVADDRDEVMENADRILGDLQDAFDKAGTANIIYIRNEALEADYEVGFVNGSYRKDVLGLNEEGT